jgi:hypothetical protein
MVDAGIWSIEIDTTIIYVSTENGLIILTER